MISDFYDLIYCTHEGKESWWEYDARGIAICRVCEVCRATKLDTYRDNVLDDPNYIADEPIDED